MPFQKGNPGGPGRPKGSPYVPPRWKSTREICEEKGFNPIEAAIDRFLDEKLPQEFRNSALNMILNRYEPQYKAIDVNMNNNNILPSVQINIVSANRSSAVPLEAQTDVQYINAPSNTDDFMQEIILSDENDDDTDE